MEREAKLAKEKTNKMKNFKNPAVSALIFIALIASNVAARPIKIPPSAPTPDSALDQVWSVLTALWNLL